MTRGGQQPVVVGGCTEAADWHITPAIPATTAFKRQCSTIMHVRLANMHVPQERASLAARPCQHHLSLYLRPTTLRELRSMWRHWSPSPQGGGVQSYWTPGSARALLSREMELGAVVPMETPEPSPAGRWGPELLDTQPHWSPP
jgi:hypothetical protein